jgi:hypothetical protein
MLQKIAAAGKSYFLLNTQSVASVGREGVKPWTGAITPHEMVSEMQTDFSTVTDDDYDGVDDLYQRHDLGRRNGAMPSAWQPDAAENRGIPG